MYFFSIIIPTYNSALTIKQCLEKVLVQTFVEYEVLILDALSKDATLEICHKFNDSRIKVFSEKDEGIYDAMNKGVNRAKGRWLYFLGSDDFLCDKNVFEKIYNEIVIQECDLIYGNAWFRKAKYVHAGEFTRIKLIQDKNICHQAIFYKKELFDSLGLYNLEFKVWADWDFNIRCFSLPSIKTYFIDTIICDYNDFDGKSNTVIVDKDFIMYLKIAKGSEDIISKKFKQSIDYKLGSFILRPIRFFKRKLINRRK